MLFQSCHPNGVSVAPHNMACIFCKKTRIPEKKSEFILLASNHDGFLPAPACLHLVPH